MDPTLQKVQTPTHVGAFFQTCKVTISHIHILYITFSDRFFGRFINEELIWAILISHSFHASFLCAKKNKINDLIHGKKSIKPIYRVPNIDTLMRRLALNSQHK